MNDSAIPAGKRSSWQGAKTHCDNDHEFTEANTYIRPNGFRDCRACMRDRRRKHQANVTAKCSYCRTRPAWAKGLCSMHYRMVRIYGVPCTGRLDPELIRERRTAHFRTNVDERAPEECWPWTGGMGKGGYGQVAWFDETRTATVPAHRAAYELAFGKIPPGDPDDPTQVDHTCHDPKVCKLKTDCPHRRCCNPAHLEAVPRSVNFERSDRSRPGNGGHPNSHGRKCEAGCTCGRHRSQPLLPATG